MAFSQSYQLFAQLFLSPQKPSLYEEILSLADINALQIPQSLIKDSDEAAATHYHIFNLETLPYESVFLEDSLLAGGHRTLLLQQAYQSFTCNILPQKVEADHISTQLSFLSDLSAQLAKAPEQTSPAMTRQIELSTQHFLQDHLLSWLPAYIESLNPKNAEKQYHDAFIFFQEVTLFILQVASEHRHDLQGTDASFAERGASQCILDSPECRIADIAKHFSTPTLCGAFLRRSDIQAIGRFLDLPSGFGPRADMLNMLFTCAAEYGSFERLLSQLQNHLEKAKEFHQAKTQDDYWAAICTENIHRLGTLRSQAKDFIRSNSTKTGHSTSSINV